MTVGQALSESVLYPIPVGYIHKVMIDRELDDVEYTYEIGRSRAFRGALADCLIALLQAINFSEADKSIGNLSDSQRASIRHRANSIYESIGEDIVLSEQAPMVYINC